MGCCGKKIKHIAQAYTGIIIKKMTGKEVMKYEFTDNRVRICQKCEFNYWMGRTLWCSICKCFIPAKTRIENENCPKGKW